MATKPTLTVQQRQALLSSLTDVGPSKLIGYLPLYTIKDFLQMVPETIATSFTNQGLAAAQFGPEKCCIKSGALYIYDRTRLREFLQAQVNAISAAGLPLDPDQFVEHIALVWFEEDHPAHSIIAATFNRKAD
ncbi:hypothetical protein [Methylocella sp. CPCC 101449]|jgi:hypothetical protein|uniref:hypothetical protein n=1 Tax=Methylocella sp. CPCC 101449 TaxID=2987531 RepID=UPI00288E2852|nr:hypothetical protein [Methylocella sp. CPCC 101449]MDT2021571.1 hypothetical protein [Methylocella sp. CPCC 101449]HEV2571663.1 hypothetical protein [Beijerinckiaceae bacterium]